MTPPFSISARPRLTGNVPVLRSVESAHRTVVVRPMPLQPASGCRWCRVGNTSTGQPASTSPTSASSIQVLPGASSIGSPSASIRYYGSGAVELALPRALDELAAGEARTPAPLADRLRLRAAPVGGARRVLDAQDDDVGGADPPEDLVVVVRRPRCERSNLPNSGFHVHSIALAADAGTLTPGRRLAVERRRRRSRYWNCGGGGPGWPRAASGTRCCRWSCTGCAAPRGPVRGSSPCATLGPMLTSVRLVDRAR